MKAATLESKFPLLAVENGCIVSKDADVTVAFKVELPELFTVTGNGEQFRQFHLEGYRHVRILAHDAAVLYCQ